MIDERIRRKGIGASEISAVLGLNPYMSAWDLWARKSGIADYEGATNSRMRVGKAIERGIADAYAQETGNRIQWSDQTVRHATRTWQLCTPDAYVLSDPLMYPNPSHIGGVDAKAIAHDQYHAYGEPGSDDVPDYVLMQCQWTCSCLDLPWWDVAACSGSELRIYRVPRDKEIEEMALEAGEKFWTDHVLAGVPPEMTCTSATEAYLKRRFPRGSGTLRVPTGEEAVIIEQFLEAREWKHDAETAYGDAEVRLKAAIGDDDGFSFSGGRITFKRTKDTVGVDWEQLARWAAGQDLERIMRQFYGVTRQGFRRLDVRVSEGK